jgi:hypothetical protein
MVLSSIRLCARIGCVKSVKKSTNRYCSRACCAHDPDRIARLRESSRKRILPMALQLDLSIWDGEESAIEVFCRGHEEAPAGLSRLAVG